MKHLFLFLTIALAALLAGAGAQTFQREPASITISSRVGGDWLVIERHNERDSPDGFHPCYTALRSAYKPVVTRAADGSYRIQFVSEIAQDLP